MHRRTGRTLPELRFGRQLCCILNLAREEIDRNRNRRSREIVEHRCRLSLTNNNPTGSGSRHGHRMSRMTSRSPASRRSSAPTYHPFPRPVAPPDPPEPPPTLLHPTISQRSYNVDDVDDEGERRGKTRFSGPLGWFGAGMWNDIRERAPWYWSDWTDAWNYRVIPSTLVRWAAGNFLGFGDTDGSLSSFQMFFRALLSV